MTNFVKFILLIYFILGMSGCQSVWQKPVPESEIIYQVEEVNTSPYYRLGFVNPTGEDNQIIKVTRKFSRPVWSLDGNFLYGLSWNGDIYNGYPAYWDLKKGKFGGCNWQLPYFEQIQGYGNPENPYQVIVQDGTEILMMDLSQCKQVRTMVDYLHKPVHIIGFSYSYQQQKLIYGLIIEPHTNNTSYKLMLRDINTGVEVQLAEGINPAWSPDGTKVAYIGLDGLYIIEINGDNNTPRKIIDLESFYPWSNGSPNDFATIPSWSPDGKWLVYHRCNTTNLCSMGESQIYKININDGNEIAIVQGGEYPSWKP
jgi:hypothetical protein